MKDQSMDDEASKASEAVIQALLEGAELGEVRPLFLNALELGAFEQAPTPTKPGLNPLSVAARAAAPKTISWMCEAMDASCRQRAFEIVDLFGHTPLYAAFRFHRIDNAEALLRAGASLDGQVGTIHHAASSSPEGLALLAQWGADFDLVDPDDGFTPIMSAARSREVGCRVENMAFLIGQNVDLLAVSHQGHSVRDMLENRKHFLRGEEALAMIDAALLRSSLAADTPSAPSKGPKAL